MVLGQGGAHYFYYKGEYYGNGAKFATKEEFVGKATPRGIAKKFWKEYVFAGQHGDKYFFNPLNCDYFSLTLEGYNPEEAREMSREYSGCIALTTLELDFYIGEILTPQNKMTGFLKEQVEKSIMDVIEHPKRDWDYPELVIAWIFYILLMIGSLIFTEFYIPWLLLTVGFVYIRSNIRKNE